MRKGTWQRWAVLLTAWICLLMSGAGVAETPGWTPVTEVTMAFSALASLQAAGEASPELLPRKAPELPGRGRLTADGRIPDYTGVIGYAAAINSESRMTEKLGMNLPWSVVAYGDTGRRVSRSGAVLHKTPVLVLSQDLKKTETGIKGMLRTVRLDNGDICYLNVRNFVTDAYWQQDPATAEKEGFCVAEYEPGGGAEPVDETGKAVSTDGCRVLLPYGELLNGSSPAPETHPVAGIVFENKTGTLYYFDPATLIIVY